MLHWHRNLSLVNRLATNAVWPVMTRHESQLATLRKKTGFAFSLCKKALDLNANDVQRAEQWLLEEASKFGWEKSVKLQNRRATQGLIGVFVDREQSNAFLIEVNCESDFVARNEHFRALVLDLMDNISNASHIHSNCETVSQQSGVSKYRVDSNGLEAFRERISSAITKLGENIKLSRASIMKSDDALIRLVGSSHAVAGQSIDTKGIQLGKYGTIVAVKELPEEQATDQLFRTVHEISKSEEISPKPDGELEDEEQVMIDCKAQQEISKLPVEQVGKVICQHIIGINPKRISLSEEEWREERTRNAANKEPELESEALLNQKLLINESLYVKDYLKFQNVDVIDFIRFECGEQIE